MGSGSDSVLLLTYSEGRALTAAADVAARDSHGASHAVCQGHGFLTTGDPAN